MITTATFQSFIQWNELATQMGITCTVATVNNSVAANNDLLTKCLMTQGTTHMLFVEADIEREPWQILALLSTKKHVTGAKSTRQEPGMVTEGDLVEVIKVSPSFMMVSREALIYLQDHPFEEHRNLCESWRLIGGHVWAHAQVSPKRTWSS